LLEPKNGSRSFRESLNDFVIASFRHQLHPEEIEAEAAAQIDRLQQAGVKATHFDTHKHAHMFPTVLRPLLRAAKSKGGRCHSTLCCAPARCGHASLS
jgi:predicted glycoside hydrolase/deacetylase ChbG (UPF0249 family)